MALMSAHACDDANCMRGDAHCMRGDALYMRGEAHFTRGDARQVSRPGLEHGEVDDVALACLCGAGALHTRTDLAPTPITVSLVG